MKNLDLFSGIGGFSLGLERAGMKTVAFCEIEEFPRKVLNKNFPGVPIYEDIRKLTAERLRADGIWPIDVICGGYPCQPFSHAGKQGGFADDRDLWPEMFRVIQEVRPRWVIGENVAGFVNMGLERTIANLESEAYEVQPIIIPACAVGALHRRDRVWIVAHRIGDGQCGVLREAGRGERGPEQRTNSNGQGSGNGRHGASCNMAPAGGDASRTSYGPGGRGDANQEQNHGDQVRNDSGDGCKTLSNATGERCGKAGAGLGRSTERPAGDGDESANVPNSEGKQGRRVFESEFSTHLGAGSEAGNIQNPIQSGLEGAECEKLDGPQKGRGGSDPDPAGSDRRPVEPGLGGSPHGVSAWLDGSWEDGIPRIAGKIPNRVGRLKGLGNAVVPQVVEVIGRAIMKIEKPPRS